MHFRRIRSFLAPSLLCAAGCGTVSSEVPDAAPDANPRIGALPVNTKAAGTVEENGTLALKGLLVSTDADTASGALVYKIQSLPTDGQLRLDAMALAVGATFTQQDVEDGRLSYAHGGAENAADSFSWALDDGEGPIPATGSLPFAITVTPVNDVPVIVNNPLSAVAEGATLVLDPARLQIGDPDSPTLTFTLVSPPARGKLEKRPDASGAFVALKANDVFTQQDIADGNVRFVDPGTDTGKLVNQQDESTSFSWRVADGAGGFNPSPTTANVTTFTVTSVDPPAISWKANVCHTQNKPVDANPVISLADVDNPSSSYSICVVEIGGGHLSYVTPQGQTVTDTIIPTLTQNGANLGVNSCPAATSLAGITLTSNTNRYGGYVVWKLMKNGAQVGASATMEFLFTRPPCP